MHVKHAWEIYKAEGDCLGFKINMGYSLRLYHTHKRIFNVRFPYEET